MKKLLFLIVFCVMFLSSCVSLGTYRDVLSDVEKKKTECEDLKKTIDEQKSALNKIEKRSMFFLDELLVNLSLLGKDEEALHILQEFQKDFPSLAYFHKSEMRDLEHKIQIKKAKEERLKLSAEQRLKETHDEIAGITWYYDTDQPKNPRRIYLYIGKKADKKWLRFKIEYASSWWLYINKCTFKIDDAIETLSISLNEVTRDVSYDATIYEIIDLKVTDSVYELVSKIAHSERTLLRCHGENDLFDREITKEEKQSLRTVLEAYKKL